MKTERWCLACLLDDTDNMKRIQVPARQIDVSSQAGMLIIKDEKGNWEHVYYGVPFYLYYYYDKGGGKVTLKTYKYEEIIISQAARIASLEEDLRIQEGIAQEAEGVSESAALSNKALTQENERLTRRCMSLNADATTWCEANGRLIGGLAALKEWIMGNASVQISRAELVDEMNKHGLWKDLES